VNDAHEVPDAAAAAEPLPERMTWRDRLARVMGGDAWTIGLVVVFIALFVFTLFLRPNYGLEALAIASLPVAFAAAGQAIVVISGGIDLSMGSVIALMNVVSASLLLSAPELSVPIVLFVLLLGIVVGLVNGILVVISRVPDIVVTLAMLYVWAGSALLVLGTPGGDSVEWLDAIVDGGFIIDLVPRALVVLLVIIGIVWIPLRRSHLGLSLYAIGSNELAAFRSGVNAARTKVISYAFAGFFAALGGLALTASTGIGQPVPGPYLLLSVAAIVLGGVSLAGGRGGLLGPIIGIFILGLIRADLLFLGVEPAFSTVIQGVIMVAVVMLGAYLTLRRSVA
jgi:ribose transport system permease protein